MTSEAQPPSDRLEALVEEAKTAYADLKREAESRAVRGEWTDGARHADEPAWFEIHKARRGRVLTARPRDLYGCHVYGFDTEGRVVVERRPVRVGDGTQAYETFWRHEPEGSARFHFGYAPGKPFIHCAWLALGPHGVTTVSTAYARGGRARETYLYGEDGRLRTLVIERLIDGAATEPEYRDITHDAEGNVSRVIWRTAQGLETLHFERPTQADRLAAVEKRLLEGLTDAIVEALAKAAIEDPVAAIAFSTSGADYQHRFPPTVSYVTEANLRRVRDDLGPGSLGAIWNPAEWEDTELALSLDESLSRACALASQDVWQEDLQAQADHTLLRLATAVEARALPLKRGEAFVVVVVEIDGEEEAGTQVAGQVGAEVRGKLRGLGLLGLGCRGQGPEGARSRRARGL